MAKTTMTPARPAVKKQKAAPAVIQAARDNTGKPQLGRVLDFPHAMAAFANVCQAGDEKYTAITGADARYNWRRGFPLSKLVDSTMRHLTEAHNAVDIDEETACLHVAQAMWNCAAFIETQKRHGEEFDDRDFEGGLAS